jgi:hypothetical protein
VATIFTENTTEIVSHSLFTQRVERIKEQTHEKYCRQKDEIEIDMQLRSEARSIPNTEPEPLPASSSEMQLSTQLEIEVQATQPTMSIDTLNALSAQMRAKAIDPDTAILASLGEHYVLTIRQWMRLFTWASYPRATQYFKELRENGLIFHKDREGRGGSLVSCDWFFLLTKGANELLKRRQAEPSFKLEPNEATRASGDTLVHTFLVNEVLIHLRLLERAHPSIITIEHIDHERIMRRNYLNALGTDVKLYPDGFLRVLVPTRNGLKRKYMFLELEHTTQKDGANWKTKCRKYLALFDYPDMLERFFSTRVPLVLVLTIGEEYVLPHKQWTEEVLQEAEFKGRDYSSRFLIGAYDPGIRDNTLSPAQFFCTPRFSTPFLATPHALFGT